MRKTVITSTVVLTLAAALSACGGGGGGGGGGGADKAAAAKGPITIWYSNNQDEVKWGKAMVAAWNTAHPDEKVTGQEIPAGKSSEEVITAAITAGNAPCLIYNTAPAAVPGFQKQGGLVALDDFPDGKKYIEERTGKVAEQYRSQDGKYYQMPWKSNPVMIFYNKKLLAKAGVDPEKPPLATYDDFLATSRKIVQSKAAQVAIWPAPTSEFFQSWFDFYPLFAAESGGKQLVEDGKAQFTSPEGEKVANFWKTMYAEKLASREQYNGDAFADQKSALSIVGPWAIAVYGGKVDWGVAPVPTSTGKPTNETWTFSDAKNIAMYSACKNRGTAWELLKFSTSKAQDQALLQTTGQMPLRKDLPTTYPDYFKAKPAYMTFADQAGRTVEVPNVPNSIEVWQTFRDTYSRAVISGQGDVDRELKSAADKVEQLVSQS